MIQNSVKRNRTTVEKPVCIVTGLKWQTFTYSLLYADDIGAGRKKI